MQRELYLSRDSMFGGHMASTATTTATPAGALHQAAQGPLQDTTQQNQVDQTKHSWAIFILFISF